MVLDPRNGGVSITTRLPSPGWSSGMPSGSAIVFSARAISPECGRCGDLEDSIDNAFFHCPIVRPLYKVLEGCMVRILSGKFFVLETSSVCSNVVPKLNRQEHCVSLLTRYYACRDLDDEKEGTLRG